MHSIWPVVISNEMPEINPKLCKKSAFPRKPVFKWYHTSAFFNFVSSQHLLLKYNSTYGSIILESNVKKKTEETITRTAVMLLGHNCNLVFPYGTAGERM